MIPIEKFEENSEKKQITWEESQWRKYPERYADVIAKERQLPIEQQIINYFFRIYFWEREYSALVKFIMANVNLDEDTAMVYLDDIVERFINEHCDYKKNSMQWDPEYDKAVEECNQAKNYSKKMREVYTDSPGEYTKYMMQWMTGYPYWLS